MVTQYTTTEVVKPWSKLIDNLVGKRFGNMVIKDMYSEKSMLVEILGDTCVLHVTVVLEILRIPYCF